MSKKKKEKISLNAYLATYSRKRNLDTTIKKWYMRKYNDSKYKTIESWNKIIQEFYNESESK